MIAKLTRILSILPIFLLFFFCKSLAVIRYVNVNNPTPGAGTSWATAFNNLQSALAVTGFWDEVWVAQGTYKPALPAGRSATFTIPYGAAKIYGGFNGTETSNTQRNPRLYPTILSGDIGVAGNKADNCYHVVTVENTFSNPTLDGFTIRDGQADAGYPASSIAAPDNTGGGVLVLAHPAGEISIIDMHNCILTSNFAVYGGGLGAFSDGGTENYPGGSSCIFDGNQAVYGGAFANTASNGVWAAFLYSSCIFINNTASAANASVMYQSINNAASNCMTSLNNCLFYNEAVPMFTSLTAGPNYSFDIMYGILWTSGSAYAGGYATGNSPVNISNDDINGTLPSSDDFNADPLFVNAIGGDFHVSPCSPVVDAGSTFAGSTDVDLDDKPRKQGTAVDIGPYEQVKGTVSTAPTVTTPVPNCLNGVASPLTATGSNLLWYTAASGGTGSSVAPTPSTAAVGSTTYYVTQTPASSCESPRAPITVTISPGTAAPTAATPPPYCLNSVAPVLTATGVSLLWYTAATGGTGSSVAPTPSTASLGTIDYYVTQTMSGCESPRTTIPVTINAGAAAPTAAAPAPYCQNSVALPLTATGNALLWYTAATGGTGSTVPPTPSTASVGTIDYYVSQTLSGCESPRTTVPVTINAGVAAPMVGAPSYCVGDNASVLTATGASGASFLWYNALTGGTGSTVAPTPSTASAGMVSYYVTQTLAGGCESPRKEVDVLIKPAPAVQFTWSNACEGKATTISAAPLSGAQYSWDFGSGASVTGSGAGPYAVTWAGGSANMVTLKETSGGCQGQVQHLITVNPGPTVGIAPITTSLCAGNTVVLEAYGAKTYEWSPATGLSNSAIADPEVRLQKSIQYTVTGTDDNGCTAGAQVTLDISPDCLVYSLPDAFSPNGDGKNDVFRVKTGDDPKGFSLIVFNRYGAKVFETSNVAIGWDGMIGGNSAPVGAYVYVLQATTSAGILIRKQGTLLLIR